MLNNGMLICDSSSVKEALKKLDKSPEKALVVIDPDQILLGTITDGDVRRYILKGNSLDNDIRNLYHKTPIWIKKEEFSKERSRRIIAKAQIGLIPIVDSRHRVVDLITRSDAFANGEKQKQRRVKLGAPVVIMAGGKGTRLEPFSRIFPKALIPIGDKPIIEIIIDEFRQQGAGRYYISLNHKAEMIESYFNNLEKEYAVYYIKEKSYLGTAGSLKLLEQRIAGDFIVSNCDVIVKADFREALRFHKDKKALLTIFSSVQHHKIPYGVVKFKTGGKILDIFEKPEYSFHVNTGVYILNREALSFIPKKNTFDMTDLAKTLVRKRKRVLTYPINESDYIDIGQWEEYKKAIDKLQLFV